MVIKLRYIGFWIDPDDPETQHLPDPRQFIDTGWNPRERDQVIRYVRQGEEEDACLGYSWCRFECGIPNEQMGNRDLTDGDYVWPEGYVHYIEKHNVKPPEEFIEHVRRKLAEQESKNT